MNACSVASFVSDSFVIPWTVACQAPLSIEFSRQEYWSGLPFPTPGDLHVPGIKPASPESPALAGRSLTTEPPGKSLKYDVTYSFLKKVRYIRAVISVWAKP